MTDLDLISSDETTCHTSIPSLPLTLANSTEIAMTAARHLLPLPWASILVAARKCCCYHMPHTVRYFFLASRSASKRKHSASLANPSCTQYIVSREFPVLDWGWGCDRPIPGSCIARQAGGAWLRRDDDDDDDDKQPNTGACCIGGGWCW